RSLSFSPSLHPPTSPTFPYTTLFRSSHGWFGNGIRIKCWEDFVLSEGTAEYLTTRSVRATEGAAAEQAVWAEWKIELADAIAQGDRKSTRLNSSHLGSSYAVFCLKKK